MKKTILLCLLALSMTTASNAQSLKQFYAQHRTDKNVQQIRIPKILLSCLSVDREARAVLKHLKSLRVFQMEGANATNSSLQSELKNALENDGFESVLQVTESDERVDIYISQDKKFIRKVLISVGSNDELVLLQANTKLSFERLNELLLDGYKKGKGIRLKS
jgi:protoheme ferro-lyase